MKKLLFAAVAVMAFGVSNAQEGNFKAGVNLGMPMGDAKDVYSSNLGLNIAYTWSISKEFSVGATTGYDMYNAKNGGDAASFMPIAATAQYSFTDNIFAGADLGYALGLAPSGIESGMLYQPKLGYQTEKFEIFTGYKSISLDGEALSTLNFGFNYKF